MNRGVAYSRNRAIENSQGKYIAIMDHDDIAMPTRLEKEKNFLDVHDDYGAVGGKTVLIDKNDQVIKEANKAFNNYKYIKAIFLFRNVFCNSEMMIRKELIVSNNLKYDENCYGMEDFKFWIEVSKLTKTIMLDEVFLQHRIHSSSLTNTMFLQYNCQRSKTYEYLQRYSWKLSGLDIQNGVGSTIHKYIGEHNLELKITKNEIEELYKGLQMFLMECRKLDYYIEIEQYCRNIMLQYIKKQIDFWEAFMGSLI